MMNILFAAAQLESAVVLLSGFSVILLPDRRSPSRPHNSTSKSAYFTINIILCNNHVSVTLSKKLIIIYNYVSDIT